MEIEEVENLTDELLASLKEANRIINILSHNGCEIHIDIRTHKNVGLPEIPTIESRVYADLTKKRKVK